MVLKHYDEPGYAYYITSVTNNREKLFKDAVTARFLLSTIHYHRFMLDFRLYAYVIMPEHFHIIIQPSEQFSLAKIMNFIKGNFARKYNQINKRTKTVWQRGYYDSGLRNEGDVIEKIKYTHNNPLKSGLVKQIEDYEFSSYHYYMNKDSKEKGYMVPIDEF